MANKRARILYVMKILLEETDEQHPIKLQEIISHLAAYGISAERRAVYEDIEALRLFGLDIVHQQQDNHQYFVGEREFELPELKLLADAVQSSRFITHKKSKQLIDKLESMTSKHLSKELSRQIYIANRVKTFNEQVYYNIDALHRAIGEVKQITFQYRDYGLDKQLHPRREGERYRVSPYLLSWDDEKYYLVGWYERYNALAHFRVDKMVQIKILKDACISLDEKLDAAAYANRTFGMFAGELINVEIQFDNSLIGVVIDRFGIGITIRQKDTATFIAKVDVAVSPSFFSWVFQFGEKAQIVAPASMKEQMTQMLQNAMKSNE